MKKLLILFAFTNVIFCSNIAFGQEKDSTLIIRNFGDSIYQIRENICKNKFIGNSWNISSSYHLSKTNEFDVNIGRTYGYSISEPHGLLFAVRSWGSGFGIVNKHGETTQIAKLFWEYSYFAGGSLGGYRIEYIYDISNKSTYLRPSLGLSLLYFDIFYSYSIMLTGNENIFEHGVTFRINYFHKESKWQRMYEKNYK